VFGNYDITELNGKQDTKNIQPMIDTYKEFLATKEPKSNWQMPNIKRAEALAALEAKEAEEAAALEKAKSQKKGKKAKVVEAEVEAEEAKPEGKKAEESA